MVSQQGCDGSRYRFGQPWIEGNFWFWVGIFDSILAHALIVKYLSIESKNLEPVSGSKSENQFFWFGNSLGKWMVDVTVLDDKFV